MRPSSPACAMLLRLPSLAPPALFAASAALVRSEISRRSFSASAAYRCSRNGSASRPNSATMNGTRCAIRLWRKSTLDEGGDEGHQAQEARLPHQVRASEAHCPAGISGPRWGQFHVRPMEVDAADSDRNASPQKEWFHRGSNRNAYLWEACERDSWKPHRTTAYDWLKEEAFL